MTVSPVLDSELLLKMLIVAEGNIPLVVELFEKKTQVKLSDAEVTIVLSEDKSLSDRLMAALRLKNLLKISELFGMSMLSLTDKLDELDPKDMARTVGTLGTLFSTLSKVDNVDSLGESFATIATKLANELTK